VELRLSPSDISCTLSCIRESKASIDQVLRADKQVVLAAVTQNGLALQYAAPKYAAMALRADKQAVLAAVTQDGRALYYAAEALRADKEVVLAAVAQHGEALQYAMPALAQHAALQQIKQLSRHWALYCTVHGMYLGILPLRLLSS
jgi:hypothetical protein